MDIYLVFNELSASGEHVNQTEYEARVWMSEFEQVITAARKSGLIALKTPEDFFDTLLVKGYRIRDWLRDHSVDHEQQQRIRSAGTSLYHLPDDIAETEERRSAFEFRHGGIPALGLGSAYLLESIAVSLNTGEQWQVTSIALDIEEFDEQIDEIVSRQESVPHVCQTDHLPIHRDWIQDRFTTSVDYGSYLLNKCTMWFPNLLFIDNAQVQIGAMKRGTPQLRQAVRKLFELENYCVNWREGGFNPQQLASKVSPESVSVRNNPQLRGLRTFVLPDQTEAFFEWHLRLTPNAWRLHFLPDAQKRMIFVGYIGEHLPTAKL